MPEPSAARRRARAGRGRPRPGPDRRPAKRQPAECTGEPAGPALSPEQEAAVRALIGEHLRAHPEIVIEALQAWQSRQVTEQEIRQRGALAANRAELENDGVSPVAGDSQGDVTVVEFFDYQCGYCKQALPDLRRLLAEQPNLRVVFKEFPVFGPMSEFAARAALAAHEARSNASANTPHPCPGRPFVDSATRPQIGDTCDPVLLSLLGVSVGLTLGTL